MIAAGMISPRVATAAPAAPSPPAGAIIVNNGSYSPQGDLPAACSTPGYTSIQAAVTAASPGDTIYVCAGTYDEDVTIGASSLTLLGAEFGIDPAARPGPESIIDDANGPVQIEANDVTINGFTIQGAVNDPDTDPSAFGAGIWTNPGYSGTQGGEQILFNIIQDNIAGIELDNTGVLPAAVEDNLIRGNNFPGAGSGNGIEVSFGLSDAFIEGNTFSGDTNSSMVDDSFSGTDSSITVSDNTLVGGGSEGFAFGDVSDSSISDNTSIGSTAAATVDLFGGDSQISVTGNVLADGVRGIEVENPYAEDGVSPNSDLTAQGNCIAANSAAGLEEDTGGYSSPPSLDAAGNWWGSPSGPTIDSNPGGTGDQLIDQDGVVSYSPFLTASTGGACPPVPVTRKSATRLTISRPFITYGAETAQTLSGTVIGQSGDGYPRGTVAVSYGPGATQICDVTLGAGTGSASTYRCTLAATQLAAGRYTAVVAVYTPGSPSSSNPAFRYTTSTSSPAQAFSVAKDTTITTISKSPSRVSYGSESAATFTATVMAREGEAVPAGETVMVHVGHVICTITLAAGTGTCAIGNFALRPGSYPVLATYGGDANLRSSIRLSTTPLTVTG